MRGENRFNLDTIAFVVVICLLAIGVTWVLVASGGDTTPTSKPGALGVTSPSPSASASATPVATSRPVVKGQLRITAPEVDSWVQVRRAGPKGAVLFSGMVEKGNTRVFAAKILWLRLRSPPDVRLRVEGRKIAPLKDEGPVDFIVKNGKLERQG
jgi:hypothetical protein